MRPGRTASGSDSTLPWVTRPDEPPAGAHHREPRVAVAQEVLVGGAVQGQLGRAWPPARRPSRRPRAGPRSGRRRRSAARPALPPGPRTADQGQPDAGDEVAARPRSGTRRRPIIRYEITRPMRAAKRVALLRSPVTFQAMARAIRPPSSGNAGTRLNTSRSDVDEGQVARARPASRRRRRRRSWAESAAVARAGDQRPAPKQTAAISSVTAGPAAATRNSSPAESVSLSTAWPRRRTATGRCPRS